MKLLKVAAILVFGPVVGVVVALLLGSFALRPDPNFVANGGHAAPGDGFVILPYLFFSLLISIPLSIAPAGVVLFRKPEGQRQSETS